MELLLPQPIEILLDVVLYELSRVSQFLLYREAATVRDTTSVNNIYTWRCCLGD